MIWRHYFFRFADGDQTGGGHVKVRSWLSNPEKAYDGIMALLEEKGYANASLTEFKRVK